MYAARNRAPGRTAVAETGTSTSSWVMSGASLASHRLIPTRCSVHRSLASAQTDARCRVSLGRGQARGPPRGVPPSARPGCSGRCTYVAGARRVRTPPPVSQRKPRSGALGARGRALICRRPDLVGPEPSHPSNLRPAACEDACRFRRTRRRGAFGVARYIADPIASPPNTVVSKKATFRGTSNQGGFVLQVICRQND